MAEATYTYKRRENPTTWQIKRALDGVEESVKRLRSVADSSYESYEFAAENYHESGIRERERERGSYTQINLGFFHYLFLIYGSAWK